MSDAKARLIGLMMVAAGAAVTWYFAWQPLAEARAGAMEVSYYGRVFIVVPMAIIFGLTLLIGGGRTAHYVVEPPRSRAQHLVVWPLFLLSLAAGAGAHWWFARQFEALGF